MSANEHILCPELSNLQISNHHAIMTSRQPGDDQTCHLFKCPREIRDLIYAEILLDFPRPSAREQLDCAMVNRRVPGHYIPLSGRGACLYTEVRLRRTHEIETNILLANRQTFSEGRDTLLRCGRLVQVTFSDVELRLRLASCALCLIDAKYSSLCIMTYQCTYFWQIIVRQELLGPARISARSFRLNNLLIDPVVHRDGEDNQPLGPSVFVLCGRDMRTFCRAVMGETPFELHWPLSAATRQTLAFTTNFHTGNVAPAFLTRIWAQRQALQPFRSCLREFQNFSLQGSSVGLSRALAMFTLRELSSQLIPDPEDLLADVRDTFRLCMQLYTSPKADAFELMAPLRKVLSRCMKTASTWNIWELMKGRGKDSKWSINFYASGISSVLALRFEIHVACELWRLGIGPNANSRLVDCYLLGPAFEMYEMSLAMPAVFHYPDLTIHRNLDVIMKGLLVRALASLRLGAVEDYIPVSYHVAALALGYKAAQQMLELAPGGRNVQPWMEWYEDWKSQRVNQGMFCEIDDQVMKRRGITRWSGEHPGSLELYPAP